MHHWVDYDTASPDYRVGGDVLASGEGRVVLPVTAFTPTPEAYVDPPFELLHHIGAQPFVNLCQQVLISDTRMNLSSSRVISG